MEHVPAFNSQQLTSISKILADTYDGLTGSQIQYLLQDCRIPDVNPDMTKWKRLFNAFVEYQNKKTVLVNINTKCNSLLQKFENSGGVRELNYK